MATPLLFSNGPVQFIRKFHRDTECLEVVASVFLAFADAKSFAAEVFEIDAQISNRMRPNPSCRRFLPFSLGLRLHNAIGSSYELVRYHFRESDVRLRLPVEV